MNNDNLDTKKKLLQVAIDIYGLRGEVSTREITEKAGVNVAAINYYFGNKNNLLKEVEIHYANLLNGTQEEILYNKELNSTERLVRWAYSLSAFMFRFPALIELIVNLATMDKNYNSVLIERIYLNKEMQEMIENSIKEGTGCNDLETTKQKYLEIFSGIIGLVVHNIIAKTYYSEKEIVGIQNDHELEKYVDKFVRDILGK